MAVNEDDPRQLIELLDALCNLPSATDYRHSCRRLDRPPGVVAFELDISPTVELRLLWETYAEIRLFEDYPGSQWGLCLWGSDLVRERHPAERRNLEANGTYRAGDLVIGEFIGDLDILISRCDPNSSDYGSVCVSLAEDDRSAWPPLWPSLYAFLAAYVEHGGDKYWPN